MKNRWKWAVLTDGTVLKDVKQDRFSGYDTTIWFTDEQGTTVPRDVIKMLTDAPQMLPPEDDE